ncbi:MAG: response regulator [Spirochaetia bacterium]|nr:response regulator [Spirochaetia bacterium]
MNTANGGAPALAEFTQGPHAYDLVGCDMKMPGMNGVDVFTAMRRIRPDIPFILSSGYSLNESAQTILSSPRSAFLPKPYTMGDLVSVLSRLESGSVTGRHPRSITNASLFEGQLHPGITAEDGGQGDIRALLGECHFSFLSPHGFCPRIPDDKPLHPAGSNTHLAAGSLDIAPRGETKARRSKLSPVRKIRFPEDAAALRAVRESRISGELDARFISL